MCSEKYSIFWQVDDDLVIFFSFYTHLAEIFAHDNIYKYLQTYKGTQNYEKLFEPLKAEKKNSLYVYFFFRKKKKKIIWWINKNKNTEEKKSTTLQAFNE